MLASELAEFIADTLNLPCGTVLDRAKALRAAGLLSKGRQGPDRGAAMTSTDAINVLLAAVLEHKRGDDVASNVRRARMLPAAGETLAIPGGFAIGLAVFEAPAAGTALDALLDDLRTARFATWAGGESYRLTVAIENRGDLVFLALDKPKRDELDVRSAMHAFAAPDRRPPAVERQTTISGEIFAKLAAALGPPN